jgi:hypothetical protein
MAAIQLEQLNIQLNELMWKFTRPKEFLSGLRELMEFYGDRTFRLGSSSLSTRIIHTYHIPQIFMNQLTHALQTRCEENPNAAFLLADTLWEDNSFEIRRTAIEILALSPVDNCEDLCHRLERWCQPGEDNELIHLLLQDGSGNLRKFKGSDWMRLIGKWLEDLDEAFKTIGLKAALVTIRDENYTDLPSLYNLLSPVLKISDISLQPDLIEISKALAIRSPSEMLFILRQALILGDPINTTRLARKLLPELDTDTGKQLRLMLVESQQIRR